MERIPRPSKTKSRNQNEMTLINKPHQVVIKEEIIISEDSDCTDDEISLKKCNNLHSPQRVNKRQGQIKVILENESTEFQQNFVEETSMLDQIDSFDIKMISIAKKGTLINENIINEETEISNKENNCEDMTDADSVFDQSSINVQELLHISADEDEDTDNDSGVNENLLSQNIDAESLNVKTASNQEAPDMQEKINDEDYITVCSACSRIKKAKTLTTSGTSKCDICGSNQLSNSISKKTGPRQFWMQGKRYWQCGSQLCSRGSLFGSRAALMQHLRVCGKPRLYQCLFCPVKTHERASLIRHLTGVHAHSQSTDTTAVAQIIYKLRRAESNEKRANANFDNFTVNKNIENKKMIVNDAKKPVKKGQVTDFVKLEQNDKLDDVTDMDTFSIDEFLNKFINDNHSSDDKIIQNGITLKMKIQMSNEYVLTCMACKEKVQVGSGIIQCPKCKLIMLYKFLICLEECNNLEEMKIHMKNNLVNHSLLKQLELEGYLKCSRCVSRYASVEKLKEHQKVCKNPCYFKCKICFLKSLERETLVQHLKQMHIKKARLTTELKKERINIKQDAKSIGESINIKVGTAEAKAREKVKTVINRSQNLVKRYCSLCDYTFEKDEIGEDRRLCPRCSKPLQYHCSLCKVKCYSSSDVNIHIKSKWHVRAFRLSTVIPRPKEVNHVRCAATIKQKEIEQ